MILDVSLCFKMQENVSLQLHNFKTFWGSMAPDPLEGKALSDGCPPVKSRCPPAPNFNETPDLAAILVFHT